MTAPAERSGVTVIGAGPAGLAAAVSAARTGVPTTLVDSGQRLGGQFWRHGPRGLVKGVHHDIAVFAELAAEVGELIADGRISYLPLHQVWSVRADGDGCTALAVDRIDPLCPSEVRVDSDYLVLAVGAYDRQVPFPGWELPGVITVGAAQAILKGDGVAVGPRVVVAGTGPFLLSVAAGLATHGVTVLGVHEANYPVGWARHLFVLTRHAGKIVEAARYYAALARHRVPVHHRSMVIEAHGTDRLEAVTVARLDRSGTIHRGSRRRIATDVLAVGYGFTTQAELAVAADCALKATPDQTLAVVTDDTQLTSNPRVFAAGEITGVGGAQLAVAEGTIAGAAVARATGRPVARDARAAGRRDELRRFAATMHGVYPVPTAWLDAVTADTVLCRCEEITVAELDEAVALGARDVRTAKMLSRIGMGWCQGRQCGYATASLIADRTGRLLDVSGGAQRPVASPIPLGLLAQSALSDQGDQAVQSAQQSTPREDHTDGT